MSFSYHTRTKLCYEEKLTISDAFDTTTADLLKNISSASSIPAEFLVPPLLAASAHFLGKSTVSPWGTWRQPAIIYSTAVGFTGTNKSAAMDIVKNSIQQVETTQGISFQNSRINQCKYFIIDFI